MTHKYSSHVQLCGDDGMEGSHNFFVRLLTKDGWLDDSNIDMALLLLRERHKSSGNWQMKAYVGKEDRQHNKGLLGMVKGEGPKLAKSWSSVNHVCLPFNLQRSVQNSSHPTGRAAGGENSAPVVKGIWIYWRRSTSEK
ncbi:unnamed protein product [Prunus armeniaca]